MSETPKLSKTKRQLLQTYLAGGASGSAASLSLHEPRSSAEVAEPRGRVIPVQVGGSKRPFFFLHGQWKEGGFFCFPLARTLGSDQPFYVLEPYSFDGLLVPPPLEAIAAAHLRSLRAVQRQGPYVLGGWCNGGLLAYEMARQLQAEKQEIALLVLMEPVHLLYPLRFRLVRAIVRRLGKFLRRREDEALDWLLALRRLYSYLRHIYWYVRSHQYRRAERSWRFGRRDYPGIYDWSAMDYAPAAPYAGKVTFIWSSTQTFRKAWRRVEATNETEVHILPGAHMTLLTEHLDSLANCLRKSLSTLDGDGT
jgi:Thioesterase domain